MPTTELKLRVVPDLNQFQKLVVALGKELRRRGYDHRGATDERVIRLATTWPPARAALNRMGYEWHFPPEEQMRISDCVRYQMTFLESKTYAFNGLIHVVVNPCGHGRAIYCPECYRAS